MKERRFYFIIALLVILAITTPYLYAAQAGGSEYVFGGFLINAQDGNSYLAKIYQGWRGDWRFTLPYTADSGEGGYLNIFYLGLGHVARILNAPLLLAFHVARILGACCLLWALAHFWRSLFPSPQRGELAFAISSLASGVGWLAIPFGAFTADFWVAETYPFLSAYVNPHFVFGLALIVWLVTPPSKKNLLWSFLASLALGIISPFGVAIVIMVLGSVIVLKYVGQDFRSLRDFGSLGPKFQNVIAVGLGGGPVLLYDYWIAHSDPVLSEWNAQNLTLTPPLWDILLALSPVFILALIGIRQAWSEERSKILVPWAGLGLALIFIPWSLQRRFMMGLFIPLAGLATLGVEWLSEKIKLNYRTLVIILFILALPTNIIVIFSGLHAAQTQEPTIYLTVEEVQAFDWIETNTPPDALILTGPETGLYIPAHTGRRVIYGHPYETVNAETAKATVTAFFTGEMTPSQAAFLLQARSVDYILVTPREREVGADSPLLVGEGLGERSNLKLLFTTDTVQIYGVLP